MKKHTKTTNATPPKRFGKNFFKVVFTVVLVLAMAFGGIILAQRATKGLPCVEYKKNNVKKTGNVLDNIKGWVRNRNICEKFDMNKTNADLIQIKTKEIPKAKTLSIKKRPNPTGGKKDGSKEKDIFIPTRSKAEIMSFIKAVQTKPNELGHNKFMYNKFDICVPNMSINQKEPAFDGLVSGCDTCGLTPHKFATKAK